MSSDGVTKIDLHKQPPNQVSGGTESELDKEDFQKAASDAKEAVSNGANNVKEFLTGASNDAANKTSQEDPEVKEFKAAAADTAEDVKRSVQPSDKASGSDKTVLEQVSDAAAAVYNKIVPSAEAKEESEARRHLNRSGDAAKDAGEDIKTSAYELKEAVKDSARGYGNTLQDRAYRYGEEGRSVSTADSQVDDVKQDLDRFRTRASDKAGRARDQAEDKYDEAKQKGRGVWGNIKDFFGAGADKADEAVDDVRNRAYRGSNAYPSADQIKREGRASWENAKDAAADTGRYLPGRAGAAANGDDSSYSGSRRGYNSYDRTRDSARETKEDAKETLRDAKDSVKDSWNDTKRNARESWYETKHDAQDRLDDTKDSIKGTYQDAKNSVKDSYRETRDSIKDRYNETNRELNENIEHVKRSWRESMTPQNYYEAAWSKGEIPSNTEDILRSRGVFGRPGSPRLGNQDSDSQAHIEGKNMIGEDFLRQTEYGYGEENLGGDDLSDLRAAADGHGPFAKYR